MTLRLYQQRAHDAIMEWVRKCKSPCLLEAATGAGKSHVIASVAQAIHKISGGKSVLCLAPSAELVHQNRAKYLATGNPASIYSSSAGGACLRHPVVFGTPGTVIKAVDKIGPKCGAVIVDEAHGITNTVRKIIHGIARVNPNVRVIGMTATPYRLDSGYIYEADEYGEQVKEVKEPYFARLVERITAHELIGQGYLTKPVIGARPADHYDTSRLERSRTGKFTGASQEQAFEGQGRKTSKIIADIVERSRERMGVIIFAATRQHARECLESLPPDNSDMIDGTTRNRKKILDDFAEQRFKYLVNVEVLTTGYDAEHIDVVCLLRHTESAGLMQQMIGRGLRVHPQKEDCLILDYAENIETHTPDGDLFNPQISAPRELESGDPIMAICERCNHKNRFAGRPNPDEYEIDQHGYFCDLDGFRVEGDHGPIPAHYGRRCQGTVIVGGEMDACSYRWTERTCEECGAGNDIAARYCSDCDEELVDPNEKLRMEFARKKSDPYQVSTDPVRSWSVTDTMSRNGNPMYKVVYWTDYAVVQTHYLYEYTKGKPYKVWRQFADATQEGSVMPETITYFKSRRTGYWEVTDYNKQADEDPE